MTADEFVEDILQGKDRSVPAHLLRLALAPFAWLHRAGLETYLLPYRSRVRKRFRLRWDDGHFVPTVAIGNLSSGGTGKTPMAALVAKRLQSDGHRVVLLSRGYRGKGGSEPRIVSDGERILLSPEEAGDEPALLARLLPGVPVIVGKDRRRSGRLALERFRPGVVVLDDALQFWQLHRDLDIVLLDARRPFDNGWMLPRGLLREPPSHLSRAGIVVLTRADRADADALARTRARIARIAPRAQVFTATHAPVSWVRAATGEILPLEDMEDRDVFAFAGIADCGSFVATVESVGARVVEMADFGDHHAYTEEDIAEMAQVSAEAAVTTEKDLVKVAPLWRSRELPPLYALRIGMKLDDPAAFFERIGRVVGSPR